MTQIRDAPGAMTPSMQPELAKLIVMPFMVSVDGFGAYLYYARSRAKALSDAWRASAFNGWSYKEFLRRARAWKVAAHDRFGEKIAVCGEPVFLVDLNSQYIKFVRPGSDIILNSHPLDVEPPEARRGTPYYRGRTQR